MFESKEEIPLTPKKLFDYGHFHQILFLEPEQVDGLGWKLSYTILQHFATGSYIQAYIDSKQPEFIKGQCISA